MIAHHIRAFSNVDICGSSWSYPNFQSDSSTLIPRSSGSHLGDKMAEGIGGWCGGGVAQVGRGQSEGQCDAEECIDVQGRSGKRGWRTGKGGSIPGWGCVRGSWVVREKWAGCWDLDESWADDGLWVG